MDKLIKNPWYWWAAIIDGHNFPYLRDAVNYVKKQKNLSDRDASLYLGSLPVDRDCEFEWMVPT